MWDLVLRRVVEIAIGPLMNGRCRCRCQTRVPTRAIRALDLEGVRSLDAASQRTRVRRCDVCSELHHLRTVFGSLLAEHSALGCEISIPMKVHKEVPALDAFCPLRTLQRRLRCDGNLRRGYLCTKRVLWRNRPLVGLRKMPWYGLTRLGLYRRDQIPSSTGFSVLYKLALIGLRTPQPQAEASPIRLVWKIKR